MGPGVPDAEIMGFHSCHTTVGRSLACSEPTRRAGLDPLDFMPPSTEQTPLSLPCTRSHSCSTCEPRKGPQRQDSTYAPEVTSGRLLSQRPPPSGRAQRWQGREQRGAHLPGILMARQEC